ncbi:GNAT family N-acetyltransferase [Mucilaginibacter sp.]|uniref:GNAT family N-acetyltransferase n=1 Tax=Mucilaginibacter sp. TaxID=1882438 RepID=UPI003D0F304B
MVIATNEDGNIVVDLLTKAFVNNKSVNFIVQHENNIKEIMALMEYSFDVCLLFGQVYLSNDKGACALILYPQKKKFNIRAIWLDIKLVISTIGLSRINTALGRESAIKKIQPKIDMTYLWFIGVDPDNQHHGLGTKLLQEVIQQSEAKNLPIYLETSTLENLPWYEKLGFQIYNKLDLTYTLYFLRR